MCLVPWCPGLACMSRTGKRRHDFRVQPQCYCLRSPSVFRRQTPHHPRPGAPPRPTRPDQKLRFTIITRHKTHQLICIVNITVTQPTHPFTHRPTDPPSHLSTTGVSGEGYPATDSRAARGAGFGTAPKCQQGKAFYSCNSIFGLFLVF